MDSIYQQLENVIKERNDLAESQAQERTEMAARHKEQMDDVTARLEPLAQQVRDAIKPPRAANTSRRASSRRRSGGRAKPKTQTTPVVDVEQLNDLTPYRNGVEPVEA